MQHFQMIVTHQVPRESTSDEEVWDDGNENYIRKAEGSAQEGFREHILGEDTDIDGWYGLSTCPSNLLKHDRQTTARTLEDSQPMV